MNRIVWNERWKKRIFYLAVLVSFTAILIYNFLTPLMSDDLLFDASVYNTPLDIIRMEYKQYITWTGRSVLQIILKVFSLMPKWVFNICNSICFVGCMLLVYVNVKKKEKYDTWMYVIINLLMWNFSVEFDQTVLWLGGACNYLWGIVIILGFLTYFKKVLRSGGKVGRPYVTGLVLFMLGVLAGWGNENTSGGAILIAVLYMVCHFLEYRKINRLSICGLAGMIIGFLLMLLAPGNRSRGALMKAEETYGGIMRYVSRGLKINKAVNEYMILYIVVICLLMVYLIYKGKKLCEWKETLIFITAALATCYVLIFTPEPMPRAYFGANIFLMIACVQLIGMIGRDDRLLYSLKIGGALAGTLWMFLCYTENGANLARIMREVNEREEYILEQTADGKNNLTLPMLRPEFQTKYSFMYENDISDEDFWMNEVYCMKYGLESINVISRDEWEQYND